MSDGLATLKISGLAFNLSSGPLDLNGGQGQLSSGFVAGTATVNSVLGSGNTVQLGGAVANSTASVAAAVQVLLIPKIHKG